MRVALSIFKYFPYGGIQRDMLKVARECLRRGHEVKIFTLRWEGPAEPDLDVEVLPIVGLNRHSQYDHFAVALHEAVAEDKFDLLVGFNKMPGLDVYYAGDSCYLEKSLTQRSALYRLLPRFRSFVAAERAVFSSDSATQILTLSSGEVPRYRHLYRTQPDRFHELPPGIERNRIAPADVAPYRAAVRTEHGLAEHDNVVLFLGSGFIKKGLDRALLALAALPAQMRMRTHMFVIGRDKADAFERLAMRLGVSGQVTFYAEGRDDIPRFLFAADALIHPAYDETAGMVIVEALLAGLPAVVTKNCGYASYLQKYQAGIVLENPFSQTALNEALLELLTSDDREYWRRNGIAAGEDEQLFRLVPTTVDLLERFAAEKRPRLVFALFRYFPYGGLQRDFMRIAMACRQAGYEIVVYCLTWQGNVPEGFRVIRVPAESMRNHVKYQRFAELVAAEAAWHHPAAVIGFNKIPGLDLYYAADSCFEQKAQEMRTPLYRLFGRYRVMSRFEKAVFDQHSATRIMLITEHQRALFQKYYQTQDERLTVVPPGISADRARPENWRKLRAGVRAEFELADDEFLMVLVGSGFITKGLDRALQALASLPDELASRTRLLVIGQDNPGQFQRLAVSLGVAERLIIDKGREDIPAILQGADLMIHPAYMESGGMVLIEAVIAGLPVIATSVCGFAHFINNADAGVVLTEPFEQPELDEQVALALGNDARRQQWSANGVKFGRARQDLYDMPKHALEFIEAFLAERGVRVPVESTGEQG